MCEKIKDDNSLSSQFQKILDVNEELNSGSLPTNHEKYQKKVLEYINLLEEMTKNINSLAVFSKNETIDEIHTENLKYLLLPALLADFVLKNQKLNRLEVLETAQIYYKDFIARLNDYELCDINLKDDEVKESDKEAEYSKLSKTETLAQAAKARDSKIKRYRQMKELENELEQLKKLLNEQQKGDTCNEEILREFYIKMLRRWLHRALDELANINLEIPIVKMRNQILKCRESELPKRKTEVFKPVIIAKDQIQKQVFGAGYPSIATYSVDDFIQKKIDDGSLQMNNKNIYNNSLYDWALNPEKKKQEQLQEEERRECLIERDDAKEIDRLRRLDDWKDGNNFRTRLFFSLKIALFCFFLQKEHKRGEGNRHNMG